MPWNPAHYIVEHDPRPLPSGAPGGRMHIYWPTDFRESDLCFVRRCPPMWMHNHPEDGDLAVTHGEHAILFTWDEWEQYPLREERIERMVRRAHGVAA